MPRLGLLFGWTMVFAGVWWAGRHPDESGRNLLDHFLEAGPGH